MTILFVGAEDSDISYKNGAAFDTGTGNARRAAYSRGAYALWGQDPAALDPNPGRVTFGKWSAAASKFWVTLQLLAMVRPNNNNQSFVFRDASGVSRLMLRGTGGATYKLSKRNAAGVITDIGTFAAGDPQRLTLTKVDIYVDYSAAGSVSLYYNGMLQSTVSGDLTTDGISALQQFEVGGRWWYADGKVFVSEVIVADVSTTAMSLMTLTSSTAGSLQEWSGAAANANQVGHADDGLFVYASSPNLIQQYKPASASLAGLAVKAVAQSARALVGAAGPKHVSFVTQIGATKYESADLSPLTSFNSIQSIQETNPATSSPWAVADIAPANLQYGVKSKA